MELDVTGWPQLPPVGLKIKFCSGDVVNQCAGVCTIVRADHVTNASGKPGGRVVLRTRRGEEFAVPLSQVRSHARIVDGYIEDEPLPDPKDTRPFPRMLHDE